METMIFIFFAIIALLSFGVGMGQIFSKMSEHRYLHSRHLDCRIIGVKADSLFTSYYIIQRKVKRGPIAHHRTLKDNKRISLKFRSVEDAVKYISNESDKG